MVNDVKTVPSPCDAYAYNPYDVFFTAPSKRPEKQSLAKIRLVQDCSNHPNSLELPQSCTEPTS